MITALLQQKAPLLSVIALPLTITIYLQLCFIRLSLNLP